MLSLAGARRRIVRAKLVGAGYNDRLTLKWLRLTCPNYGGHPQGHAASTNRRNHTLRLKSGSFTDDYVACPITAGWRSAANSAMLIATRGVTRFMVE